MSLRRGKRTRKAAGVKRSPWVDVVAEDSISNQDVELQEADRTLKKLQLEQKTRQISMLKREIAAASASPVLAKENCHGGEDERNMVPDFSHISHTISPLRLKPSVLRRQAAATDAIDEALGLGTARIEEPGKVGGRRRSGRVETREDLFLVDVAWPHNFLATRDVGLSEKGIPYNALDLRLLTLGELEILALPSLSSEERRARSTLLKDILYYAANYEWGDLLRLHASVLTEVERGTRQWTDSTARLEQQILLQANRKSSITNLGGNSKVSQGGDKQKRADYWCFDFN